MACDVSADALGRLLGGRLDGPTAASLERHVEGCPACQERLAHLTHDPRTEEWRSLLAGGGAPGEGHDPAFVRRLVESPLRPLTGPAPIRFPGPPTSHGALGSLGPYHVVRELGAGATGVVYLVYDASLGRPAALKVLRPEWAASASGLARFEREARAAVAVRHDAIVTIYQVYRTAEFALPALVMEYVEGESLAARLRRAGPLEPAEAARAIRHLAEGLEHAHRQGLVHRDVKPANILLETASGRGKLVDFGIARAVQDGGLHARLTHTGNVVGTPAYMSPEHALSPGNVGPCGDVYGLGAVLYEALTGEPPFRGTGPRLLQQVVNDEPRPPGRLNDRVPRDLETICLKCLQKEPARRYASAGALADDLGRFLRDEPVLARPPGWLEWTWRKAKAHKPAVIVGGVILAVILAVAIVGPILAVVYSALAANERTAKVAAEEAELRMGAALAQAEAERERGYTIIQRESIRAARRALRDDLRADARGALLDVPASGRGWEWHRLLYEADAAPVARALGSHDWAVTDLLASRDGRVVVSSGPDGRVVAWDQTGGRSTDLERGSWSPAGRLWRHALYPLSALLAAPPAGDTALADDCFVRLCWIRDGALAAGVSLHGKAVVWDVRTGRADVVLRHGHALNAVAASAEGNHLLVADDQGSVLYQDRRRAGWTTLRLAGGPAIAAAHLPPERWLIAHGAGGLTVVDLRATGVRATYPEAGPLWDLAVAPDGRRVAVAGPTLALLATDVAGGGWLPLDRLPTVERNDARADAYHAVQFAPDGASLAAGDSLGRLLLWRGPGTAPRLVEGGHVPVMFHDRRFPSLAPPLRRRLVVAWGPGGRLLAAGHHPVIKEWVPGGQAGITRLTTAADPHIQFDPAAPARLWVGGRDGTLSCWDSQRGTRLGTVRAHAGAVTGLAIPAGGAWVLTAGADGALSFWTRDPAGPRRAAPTIQHARPVRRLALSPDGTRAAIYDDRDEVTLRDVPSGRELARRSLRSTGQGPTRAGPLAFNADGSVLAVAGPATTFWLLSGITLAVLDQPYAVAGNGGTAVAWHPRQRDWVVAGDTAGRVYSPGLNPRPNYTNMEQFKAPVAGLAFSPDGRRLGAAFADGSVALVDPVWQGYLAHFSSRRGGADAAPCGLAFDPAGRRLAVPWSDGRVEIWESARPSPPIPETRAVPWQASAPLALGNTNAVRLQDAAICLDGAGGLCVLYVQRQPDPAAPDRRDRCIVRCARETAGFSQEPIEDLGYLDDHAFTALGRTLGLTAEGDDLWAVYRRPRPDLGGLVGQILLRRRDRRTGRWDEEPVGTPGNWGFDVRLVRNDPGRPTLAYFSHEGHYLMVSRWAAGRWQTHTVGRQGDGFGVGAAGGPDGRLHLVFRPMRFSGESAVLTYLGVDRRTMPDAVREVIDSVVGVTYGAVAATDDGLPLVAYFRPALAGGHELVVNRRSPTGWVPTVLFNGEPHFLPHLTRDPHDTVRLTCWDADARAALLFTGRAGAWTRERIDLPPAPDEAPPEAVPGPLRPTSTRHGQAPAAAVLHFLDARHRPVIVLEHFVGDRLSVWALRRPG